MDILKNRILAEGLIKKGNIVNIDSFLNHQIDVELLEQIGERFYQIYKDSNITKIVTIEAHGIAIAYSVARLLKVPMVYAKKVVIDNVDAGVYHALIHSYTHNIDQCITINRNYLSCDDNVLIIDDFLGNGCAITGLLDLCNKSKCKVCNAGVVIESSFLKGRQIAEGRGLKVSTLVQIESIIDKQITFR